MSMWSKAYLQICRERVCIERAIADLNLYISACKRSGESTAGLKSRLNELEVELHSLDGQMHDMLHSAL